MKVAEHIIDSRFLMDVVLVVLLIAAILIYIDSSAEFQILMTSIKHNSAAGLNDGLTVLDATAR